MRGKSGSVPTWLIRNPVAVADMMPAMSPNPRATPMRKLAYLRAALGA